MLASCFSALVRSTTASSRAAVLLMFRPNLA
jgi:hypothetical protein